MKKISLGIFTITFLLSCGQEIEFSPKPMGFQRIDLPVDTHWKAFDTTGSPYKYEYPSYAVPIMQRNSWNQSIYYPQYKATLYGTYIPLDNEQKEKSFFFHSEYSRNLVYEHSIKADEINEKLYLSDTNNVYGIIYEIGGNVASNYQFFISDSVNHFYRGSLYFESKPNVDSIQPVLDFLKADITRMIESFKWNK